MNAETIPALLAESVERHADRDAVIDGDVTLTYAQLGAAVARATDALLALGIERGDRVAIWAPNMHEWIIAALAIHSAGAVLVPINTRYRGTEAAYILQKSGARVLFTVTGFLGTDYVSMLEDTKLPSLESIILLRGTACEHTRAWQSFLTLSTASALPTVSPDDLSDILFTSGTTGQPKGVMCTHAQTLRAYRAWSEVVGLDATDRYLVVAPFFHCFGYKAGWLACLIKGATIVPQPTFDVDAVLARIAPDRITVLPGPPALYQTLLARSDLASHDLTTLRLAVTGAASIPVTLIERMRDELGFETVITGYGLTEACGIATMCRFDDDPETIATTSGRAIPGVEVIVADDRDRELPRGQPGEVLVRGYNVMRGYFDDDAETAAAVTAEGWLHTGDIGVMDDRGYLRITDRKKDMYIVGGFNAYPAEIENILSRHQAIAQVAVVGVPDERLGEVGMAFVICRPGASLDQAALIEWSRQNMANFKVPRHVRIVDSLPMNATGKVLKYELRARALELLS